MVTMWIFTPGGLLMPSEFPADKVDSEYMDDARTFDLQIRARVRSHLDNFIRDYMDPQNLEHSAVQATPGMDYNFRFYCRRADFAVAIAQAVLDIDYEKFKPTAEDKYEDGTLKYADGKEYHGVLNSIWGTVTRLGAPGGVWGTYRGKGSAAAWGSGTSKYTGRSYASERWYASEDSRLADYMDGSRSHTQDRPWWREEGLHVTDDSRTDDERDSDSLWKDLQGDDWDEYVPASEKFRQELLDIVEGVPAIEWEDYLEPFEMEIVKDEHLKALAKDRKRARKQRGKGRHSVPRQNPLFSAFGR